MKKVLTFLAVVAVMVATAVSCQKEQTPEQKPDEKPAEVALTGITIDPAADFELAIGATKALTVKYVPENATNKPAATWASSATAVATVADGTVTAVAAGEAEITATVGEFTAKVKVTVPAAEPEDPGIKVDGNFGEWDEIDPIAGDGALKTFKAIFTEADKVYFYLELDKSKVSVNESLAYAHKVKFCFDDGDNIGGTASSNWNGSSFDFVQDMWLLLNGKAAPKTWGLDGFAGAGVIGDDTIQFEICFSKSVDEVLSGDCIRYAAYITDQTCDTSSGSEVWSGKDTNSIGNAPKSYEDMAVIGELPEVEVWDFEPGDDFDAATNLWYKKAFGNELVFMYQKGEIDNCIVTIDEAENIEVEESTYVISYDAKTNGDWENQFALYPNLDNALALDPEKTYLLRFQVGASENMNIFFKAVKYDAQKVINETKPEGACFWEWGRKPVRANVPYNIISPEITGVETEDLVLFFDFGGNPEDVEIYIKDIYFEEVGAEEEEEDDWDYTPSEDYLDESNLWLDVDAAHDIVWDGLGEEEEPDVEFKMSTYTFVLENEDTAGGWNTQFRIVSDDFVIDPAKTYDFYCTIYSSTGTKAWIKMHQNPTNHWPELFETEGAEDNDARLEIEPGETVFVELEDIHPLYTEPTTEQCLLFLLSPHGANNTIHIKDIILREHVEEGGEEGGDEEEINIVIDGEFDDWANVEGRVIEDGPLYVFKCATDADYIYFYCKRNRRTDYWGNYGYFYFGIDEDNNPETQMGSNQGMPGADEWILIYPFGGTNDAPEIYNAPGKGGLNSWDDYTFEANSLAGVFDDTIVEIEFKFPRAELKEFADKITVFAWGNKSADSSTFKTTGVTIDVQN